MLSSWFTRLFFTLSQNDDQHQVRPPNLDDLPLPLLHRQRHVLGSVRHRHHHPPHQYWPGHLRHHQRHIRWDHYQVREDIFCRTQLLIRLSPDLYIDYFCFLHPCVLITRQRWMKLRGAKGGHIELDRWIPGWGEV